MMHRQVFDLIENLQAENKTQRADKQTPHEKRLAGHPQKQHRLGIAPGHRTFGLQLPAVLGGDLDHAHLGGVVERRQDEVRLAAVRCARRSGIGTGFLSRDGYCRTQEKSERENENE